MRRQTPSSSCRSYRDRRAASWSLHPSLLPRTDWDPPRLRLSCIARAGLLSTCWPDSPQDSLREPGPSCWRWSLWGGWTCWTSPGGENKVCHSQLVWLRRLGGVERIRKVGKYSTLELALTRVSVLTNNRDKLNFPLHSHWTSLWRIWPDHSCKGKCGEGLCSSQVRRCENQTETGKFKLVIFWYSGSFALCWPCIH